MKKKNSSKGRVSMGALACISVEDALVCQVLKDDVVRELKLNVSN